MPESLMNSELRDIRFVMLEQVGLTYLNGIPRFSHVSSEVAEMILEESHRLAESAYAPINAEGDWSGGCHLEDGSVHTPRGFREAYGRLREGGWMGLSLGGAYGGQDLPLLLRAASDECFVSANPSLHTYPGLTASVAGILEEFGSEEQKNTFLGHLISGRWTGTMCMTEPNAGSDIGDISTSAIKRGGRYYLRGTKQFITGGDHDLTDNIVHLVLARVEGAPKGAIGISLFIVPKFKVLADGAVGPRNDVTPLAVEKKMGLKGSATTQLRFGDQDDCEGFLVGGEGEGLLIMLHLMYEARNGVAHQAMAMSSRAYAYALKYAKERIQGAPVDAMGDPNVPRVPILHHPDVRRMLLEARAYVSALRRITYYLSALIDRARNSTDPQEVKHCKVLCGLLIPVAKSYATDRGLDVTNLSMLIHGGYGYTQEYHVEQMLRDVKVTSVYEGTNGIQANDLLLRHVLARRGKALNTYLLELDQLLARIEPVEDLARLRDGLRAARLEMSATTDMLHGKRTSDVRHLLLVAVPYCEMMGHLFAGHMLVWGAEVAHQKLIALKAGEDPQGTSEESAFYLGTIKTASFFVSYVLPKLQSLAKVVRAGDRSPLEMPF